MSSLPVNPEEQQQEAVQQELSSETETVTNEAVTEEVSSGITAVNTPVSTRGEGKILQAHGLVKKYGRRQVVRGVDLRLEPGEIVALLGPNGAGKTTTFYMMVGFVKPNKGDISLNGNNITRFPMHKRARRGVGYLAQEPSAFRKMSARDNLMAVLEFQDLTKAEQNYKADSLLEEFGLTSLANSKADTLSGGERRRLEIARSLTIDPDFLLLDEPFTGVDPKSIHDIQTIVAELKSNRGLGVLLTEHSVRETLAIADRVYLMYDGKVEFEGTPAQFGEDDNVRSTYLGSDFQL